MTELLQAMERIAQKPGFDPEAFVAFLDNHADEIIEKSKQEAKTQPAQTAEEPEEIDPWEALDIDSIAVDTGRTDGSMQHDHYIYGTPKRNPHE